MRHPSLIALCAVGTLLLSACARDEGAETAKALKELNVIDESNLNNLMLSSGDPNEAVAYFARTSAQNPERVELKRGLAMSLVRAQKPDEAAAVWREVAQSPEATNDDRVALADALIRSNKWKEAEAELNKIPPTFETYERYRLEAMVADSNQKWTKADSFYETAFGLTTKPSSVLNNWGYSKLTRGDHPGAEKLFEKALTYDPNNFTTKNNLVLARAAQGKYDLPNVRMTQTEKAELTYTAALSAIKKGDVAIGKTLLQEAINTHPQHFEQAARALETLESNISQGN